MQLLRPIGNTRRELWDGISFKSSAGVADGQFHFVSSVCVSPCNFGVCLLVVQERER